MVTTKDRLERGITCACGAHLAPSDLYRITCPVCGQVHIAEGGDDNDDNRSHEAAE